MFQQYVQHPERLWTLLVQLSVFGLVAAIWFAGLVVWLLHRSKRTHQLQSRLGMAGSGSHEDRVLRLWHDGQVSETVVPGAGGQGILERLERVREDAGWITPMPQILLLLTLAIILSFLLSWFFFRNILLGLSVGAIIALVFRGYLMHCTAKRTQLFEKQLVDALDLGARSLRAGHPLSGAFRLISEEIAAPIGRMFTDVVEQESLGMSVQSALADAAARYRNPDVRIFAASVIIQLRSGGNLADMMERVAWVVRERMRLNRRARVLTAEAQLSKWVLMALPVGVFMLLNILNPNYMKPFYENFWGKVMLIGCVISMTIGGWVMGQMARLKY